VRGAIGAGVVDDDHLERAQRLGEHGPDGPDQSLGVVVGDHDDADERLVRTGGGGGPGRERGGAGRRWGRGRRAVGAPGGVGDRAVRRVRPDGRGRGGPRGAGRPRTGPVRRSGRCGPDYAVFHARFVPHRLGVLSVMWYSWPTVAQTFAGRGGAVSAWRAAGSARSPG